jgi:hypothetical protein
MASPGWYPDPNDAAWQKFYDGHRWTGDRRPAGPPVAPQWSQPVGAPQWGPPPPRWGPPPPWTGGPPPRRGRIPLVVTLVVVVVAGLAIGGFFLFRGKNSPSFTFDGQSIDRSDRPLAQAATTVDSLVATRHGAKGKNTRCYYGLPRQPVQGAEKRDIDHSAWCGPVAFVDGDPTEQYLSFPLTSQPANGGKVALTPSAKPVPDAPQAVPAGLDLERPDNARAPSGPGGVAVPAPPPAARDALVTSDLGHESIPAAPRGAAMGTTNGGVSLSEFGPVTRYGTGDAARSAPEGQKLIAFRLEAVDDDRGDPVLLTRSATVSVDGSPGRNLPTSVAGEPFVAAVPTSARSVDLVLTDGGYRQTLSLLSGRPGSGNITLFARQHRSALLFKSGSVEFRFSAEVVFGNGSSGTIETGRYTSTTASLYYSIPGKHANASGRGRALLYIDIGYTSVQNPGRNFGFPAQVMTFIPKGQHSIRARNIASGGLLYNVFDVSAGLTSGTLRISGSFTTTFTNTGRPYTTTVATPISIPVGIAAG